MSSMSCESVLYVVNSNTCQAHHKMCGLKHLVEEVSEPRGSRAFE